MMRSTRRGFFRHSYDISVDGVSVTLTGTRREGCVFEAGGERYEVVRRGHRGFLLIGPIGEEASAERAGGRTWEIRSTVGPLELVRTSIWKETWELRRFGEPMGTLAQDGVLKRTSTAELSAELPLPIRLFVLYVVETIWERGRQAAAAG